MITFLEHRQIDQAAWDLRLDASVQPSWYGRSTVLNAAAPGWSALVDGDTGAQMPLPGRRRYGIHYLFQPFLLQHIGPFGPGGGPALAAQFLRALPRHFRYADIQLQVAELPQLPHWRTEQRQNHVLRLDQPAETLRAAYGTNHKRNLRKAAQLGVEAVSGAGSGQVIAALELSDQFRRWGLHRADITAMHRVLQASELDGTGFGCIVHSAQGPAAAAWFVRHGGSLLFLKGAATAAGRDLRAMYALIDHVVGQHAGSGLLLDFAGGNDPGLARFYTGFGARPVFYLRALMNRLPPVVRLLKP